MEPLNDDLFISFDDRIGKMLHNICVSAVAVSLRWATRGPWASCFLSLLQVWTELDLEILFCYVINTSVQVN